MNLVPVILAAQSAGLRGVKMQVGHSRVITSYLDGASYVNLIGPWCKIPSASEGSIVGYPTCSLRDGRSSPCCGEMSSRSGTPFENRWTGVF